jgi:uncharacterized membrane protein
MRFGIFAIFMLLTALSSAAYVHGSIYQENLEPLNKTIIRVDGPFTYQTVSDKSNYSFYLPPGEYKLSAQTTDDPSSYAETTILVGGTNQQVDLVLKPSFQLSDLLPFTVLLVVALALVYFFYLKPSKQRAVIQTRQKIEPNPPKNPIELDDDAKSILRVLDSFEGRATQKEIKETIKFSDAKLSLILTELEQTGHVKKFKRGRANVIRKI